MPEKKGCGQRFTQFLGANDKLPHQALARCSTTAEDSEFDATRSLRLAESIILHVPSGPICAAPAHRA